MLSAGVLISSSVGFVKDNDASAGVERESYPRAGPRVEAETEERVGSRVVNELSEDECASIVGGAVNSQ